MPKISQLTAHSNQFKFQGFVVRFSTFQGMWEVLEKCLHHGACEASWSLFRSKKEAEEFCLEKLRSK